MGKILGRTSTILFQLGSIAAFVYGDIVKTDQVPNLNLHYGSKIVPVTPSTLEENDKLSGTNIEVKAVLVLDGGAVPAEHWTKNVLVELIMGGQTIEIFRRDPLTTDPITINCWFRFATTLGSDGSEIKIRVRVTYVMQPQGYSQLTDFPSDKTYNFVAYNKCHVLGTNVNGAGTTTALFQENSDELFATVSSALSGSHTLIPSTAAGARAQNRTAILGQITPSTVFTTFTHGAPDKFGDSTWPGSGGASVSFGDDVSPQVLAKFGNGNRYPDYNLVAFWSCDVLPEEDALAPDAYGISAANQAILGFHQKVAAQIWSKAEWLAAQANGQDYPNYLPTLHLSKHAEHFWVKIAEGKPADFARLAANEEYPPIGINFIQWIVGEPTTKFPTTPMSLTGDQYSRMKYVYLEKARWDAMSASQRNVWWILIV